MRKISVLLFLGMFLLSCQPEEEEFTDLDLSIKAEIPGSEKKNEANRIRVKNIEALRKLPFPNTQNRKEVQVLGYYEPGDGGGGNFYWDPFSLEKDNGGTIIMTNGRASGRWVRIFEDVANVKWFGANENHEDNIKSLNNAINDPRVKELIFPKGTFQISSTWKIPRNNVIIRGSGSIKFESNEINKSIIELKDVSNVILRGITVTGIGMISPYNHKTLKGHSLEILGKCQNILIEDVKIEKSGKDGIYINENLIYNLGDHGRDIIINKCEIKESTRNAISVIAGENVKIIECKFSDFQLMGVDIEPNSKNTKLAKIKVQSCVFIGNIMWSSALQARGTAAPEICFGAEFLDNTFYELNKAENSVLRISNFSGSVVLRNKFYDVGRTAIRVEGTPAIIEGNYIEGVGEFKIKKEENTGAISISADDSKIYNNKIYWVSGNGIFSSGSRSVIKDNKIFDIGKRAESNSAFGIYLWDATDIFISLNEIISEGNNLDTGIKFRLGTNHVKNTTIIDNIISGWEKEKISSEYRSEQKLIKNN